MSENLTLQLSKTIAASRGRVFAAWTQPEELMRWFAPGAMKAASISVDLRIGGAFRWEMHGPSPRTGEQMEIVFIGTFLEIESDRMLKFTWQADGNREDSTLVKVEFSDVEGGTQVALTQERIATAEILNRNKMGWGSMLEKLAALYEKPAVANAASVA